MKKILFVLMAAALFASCSEGETPEVKPGPQQPGTSTFNPTTLFTDLSCTQLQAGITKEQIETTCQVEPYRTMALQMLAGTYPGEFRIMEVEALPHPSVDATLNKTAKYGVMDNPTGISVSSRDTLRVFASGLYAAGAATFKIQTLTTSGTGGYGLGPDEIALSNGENVIVVPPLSTGKGLGYIRYYYADGTKPGNLKVNIFGGEVNGYFDPVRKHHTDADWQRLIAAAVNPYFDITGKYAAVTAPTDWYRRYTDGRGTDLVNTYDAVVYLEWKFMGLLDSPDGFDGRHRTRAYFHQEKMGEGVGAYASDYHTAYPGEYMVKPDAIAGGDIWVFGHEHGHVNQTRPAFRWAGMVEVTNNLEAMYLRTHIKQLLPFSTNTAVNTNLQTITDGGYVNTYERAFNWFIGKDRPLATPTPHNRNDNNAHLFHQLVPFWQLYLYLDNVLGKTGTHKASFYEDIYEHYRKNDASVSTRTDGQHQLYFVELVCKTANLDLSDFFLKTGFLQPYSAGNFLVSQAMVDATIDKIKSYPLPPQPFEYITDGNIDIFRERLSLQTGSGAEVNKNGKFTTPPAGWTNAVAFEVRENNADGDIKCIFTADNGITSQAFGGNGFIFNSSSGHHLYAVAHDGERREVPVSVAGSTPTPPEFTIAAGSKVQYLNPVLKTSDTWNLELSTTWIAENHIGQWGSPLLASDEDPGKDGKDQKFQYWWNAPDNKSGVISFNNNTASFARPSVPAAFVFTLESEGDGNIYITLKVNGNVVDNRRRIEGMEELDLVSKNTNYEMRGKLNR